MNYKQIIIPEFLRYNIWNETARSANVRKHNLTHAGKYHGCHKNSSPNRTPSKLKIFAKLLTFHWHRNQGPSKIWWETESWGMTRILSPRFVLRSTDSWRTHYKMHLSIQGSSLQRVSRCKLSPIYNCPQSLIKMAFFVVPLWEPYFSISRTTSRPSTTWPKTTCLPSSHEVATVHKKNWDPFVWGPAFAMDNTPGPVCFLMKFSSANFVP